MTKYEERVKEWNAWYVVKYFRNHFFFCLFFLYTDDDIVVVSEYNVIHFKLTNVLYW